MFWCYSCQTNGNCSNYCITCRSNAIEQITQSNNPKQFIPYVIQQEKQQIFFTMESLYRNVYQDLFDTMRQRRTQATRRINRNGNYQLTYIIAVDTSQDDQVRGLSANQINQLQSKHVSVQCSICQQTHESEGFVLDCKHQFHKQCLIPWITQNGTCPTCRFKLSKQ